MLLEHVNVALTEPSRVFLLKKKNTALCIYNAIKNEVHVNSSCE